MANTNIKQNQLTYSADPEAMRLAMKLRTQLPDIMSRWEVCVRSALPAAHREQLTRPLLIDHLPNFLGRIANALDGMKEGQTQDEASAEARVVARAHGAERATQSNYSLEEILSEYALLRKTLFETLESGVSLALETREMILDIFDRAIRESVTQFILIHYERLAQERAQIELLEKDVSGRDRFVSALAHDLRNPLSAARIAAELIEQHGESPEIRSTLISKVIQNVERVDKMIRDLLDANRLTSGEPVHLNWENCDLVPIVRDLVRDFSVIYQNRFELNVDEDGEKNRRFLGVYASEGIRRAVENLLSNAIKYGDPSTPIQLRIYPKPPWVAIAVHNQGNPIPSKDTGRLFRIFGRTQSAMESGKRGWGLGLLLVKSVAEAHHGKVEVESTVENGTTFTLLIKARHDC